MCPYSSSTSLFFSLPFLFLLFASRSPTPSLSLCHEEEKSALLEFKESFKNSTLAYYGPDFEILPSWESGDCCSWEGVQCDGLTHRVVGLDINGLDLVGSLNPKTSLFHLTHLEYIDLSYNSFGSSVIPPTIGNLTRLTHLNLSQCDLSGQVPREMSRLTRLSTLDLSDNNFLPLKNPDLENLVRNLTRLEVLDLKFINMSMVPAVIANLSSLRVLNLLSCDLQGDFPIDIFNHPQLQILDLHYNGKLSGRLPEFSPTSPLEFVDLTETNFSGELPSSLGNLKFLSEFKVGSCNFWGPIPSTLGNLTQLISLDLSWNMFQGGLPSLVNLTRLTWLGVAGVKMTGTIPSSIGSLVQLTELHLHDNLFTGEIPQSFSNLTGLVQLTLDGNQLTGQIPSELSRLTHLQYLDFSSNKLQGPIPSSFSQLKNLTNLFLASNNLNGTLQLDIFSKLDKLQTLLLSFNNFSQTVEPEGGDVFMQVQVMGLASCNLRKFPEFLRNKSGWYWLDLSYNKFEGQIPAWLINEAAPSCLNLSGNFLTSFSKIDVKSVVQSLDLRYNRLQGSLPVLPYGIRDFVVSNNNVSGEIPEHICKLENLRLLDLGSNQLTGEIPSCLDSLADDLVLLNLQGNNLRGRIPTIFDSGCSLMMIDMSYNQLEGPLPRMTGCINLEFLNLGNNMIRDIFPSWLSWLPELRVLILRSNRFQGFINQTQSRVEFPKLQIIDISQNNFHGVLPSEYFEKWKSLSYSGIPKQPYYIGTIAAATLFLGYANTYDFSVTITNKGMTMDYAKILSYFALIDFSSNNFSGSIPESVGFLKGLRSLNLSNNHFTGAIPPVLGDLTDLEALDLSSNNLSGEIPQELTQLIRLGFFNASFNNLHGPIPQGKQFNSFRNTSYEGNSGLCGDPLSRKCGELIEVPTRQNDEGERSWRSGLEIKWTAAAAGYGSGFTIAVVVWHIIIKRRPYWLVRLLGRMGDGLL
ncbi:hypothetical protein SAY87_018211 [Trapa incisa]|uniref:Leucine-rich repeat-containing N-terminal plant-type domain-containing protein n=1 Tax=Trapa incisa TaxID=236973 RepID=A0AAN7QSK4_9MYRT|nr:hypothetical protein SAY87_018211 [Trapa incisa]